jgi:uncharacterized protein (DUF1697 family)
MSVWIGLLRAVNVGGRKLSMKEVPPALAEVGCRDVRTYLQSGNVVFSGTKAVAAAVSPALSALAGFEVPVLLRSAAEMAAVVAAQPLAGPATAWHVTFLDARPAAGRAAGLDPSSYGGDSFELRGREVYLRTPDGYGRTKLTNALFERKLGVVATTRNWRTVCALAEMSGGDSR